MRIRVPDRVKVPSSCKRCGVEFYPFKQSIKRGLGLFCSASCAHLRLGDRSVRSSGYAVVRSFGHPRAKSGIVWEHVLVVEKAMGKFLAKRHPIHHHDRNRANNANTNLVVCESHAYHKLLHHRMRIVDAGGNPDTQKICSVCKGVKLKSEFSPSYTTIDGRSSTCKPCAVDVQRRRRRRRELEVTK